MKQQDQRMRRLRGRAVSCFALSAALCLGWLILGVVEHVWIGIIPAIVVVLLPLVAGFVVWERSRIRDPRALAAQMAAERRSIALDREQAPQPDERSADSDDQ